MRFLRPTGAPSAPDQVTRSHISSPDDADPAGDGIRRRCRTMRDGPNDDRVDYFIRALW
jgi:hypothetical protein